MARTLSTASGKLNKLFTNTTAREIRTAIILRPLAFLLIVALFFSGVLLTLPRNVKAKAQIDSPPVSAPPEPFVIHSPASESVLIPAIANFFSSVAAYFRVPSRPEGLTAVRTGADPAAFAKASNQTLLDPPPPAGATTFDFDGDGKADVSRSHSANSDFKIRNSNGGSYTTYTFSGLSGARHAEADYDGDGKTDPAFFSGGTWTIRKSSTGSTQTITGFGQSGDVPVPGHYVGSSTVDIALFRPSTGVWYLCNGLNCSSPTSISFGTSGDIPVPGDYDGDGLTDEAVFRPSTGDWHVNGSSAGYFGIHWGVSTDVPVAADYNGDGETDIAVFRPGTGTWYELLSPGFTSYTTANWGNWADQPVPADYDGDGKADIAIWRPTNGQWWISRSSDSGYDVPVLGEPGDFAIPSDYVKQVGGTATPDDLAEARLAPKNATGGTDLYSQNFSWSTGLVSLPGRAGLNLNIGISYNSLVWTKVGNSMYFDPDWSNITPGFRFGLPTIEPIHFAADKNKFTYIMVTPSGGRVEFRQTAVSNIYETADSTYTQLVTTGASDPNDLVDNITIKMTSTDGTQMSYVWNEGAFRSTEIKDRNGNLISATYDGNGRLSTITDTMGRVMNASYDSTTGLLSSISQNWGSGNGDGSATTHNWATFTYTDTDGSGSAPPINTNFGSLSVVGPPNSVSIKVLQQITYADGSYTKFSYNNYAQVAKVQNYAADNHELNRVRLSDIESVDTATAATDCPRFFQTKTYAENFNSGNEVTVTNSYTPVTNYGIYSGQNISGTRVDTVMTSEPDSLYTRSFYGSSGWQEGLPLATEDCIGSTGDNCSTRKRWTWTNWMQDDTNAAYIVNPRVTESRVGDGTNTKRTTIDYRYDSGTNSYLYGLPEYVKVYDTDLSTVLKTQKTVYNLDSDYTSRRIIGLPAETDLYEGSSSGTLMSKVTYAYDEGGYSAGNQSLSSPTQHNTANYGTSFNYRGNSTSVRRWDVTVPTTQSASVASSIVYNITGSPISQTDPRGRVSSISYSDVWNDGASRTTYAFPTTVTDPGGFSSTVKYRYDIGANVEATSPAPAGQSFGKTSKRVFDSVGRLQKESVYVNTTEQFYTRYEYPTNDIESKSYSTVVDTNAATNLGPDSADEVLTDSWFDGAGRVRGSRTEHPGSSGGWSATKTTYDILGRVLSQSVPTEVSVSSPYDPDHWSAAGDDSIRGFVYSYSYYDWKGRPVRTVPSDSNGSDGKDTLISYEGCGCAGGQVTTISGPVTTAVDVSGTTQTTKRRTNKLYEDILGRQYKSEIWDLDGGGSAPYSTTKATLNGLDQPTLIRQYAGSDFSSTYQDTTMSYDGHGRLASRHLPEYDSGANMAWTYNLDYTVATMTDPRGDVTTYTYENVAGTPKRPLMTNIQNTPHSGGVDAPDVTLAYDNLGNRTSMDTNGVSNVTYAYDSLSRMTSETTNFDDLTSNYTLTYTYELSGALKSITDPFSATISYANDKAGRPTAVASSGFNSITDYATGIEYRAFGGLKQMSFGSSDSSVVSYSYDNRLRPDSYQATSTVQSGGYVRQANYAFDADGQVNSVDNVKDGRFDESYKFDFAGRINHSESGTVTNAANEEVPAYTQGLTYDSFGNITHRTTGVWGSSDSFTAAYTNNRKTGGLEIFDAAGRIVDNTGSVWNYDHWTFDASGRLTTEAERVYHASPTPTDQHHSVTQETDGDGLTVKREEDRSLTIFGTTTETDETLYYVRSSVLGGAVITEIDDQGNKKKTHVFLGKGEIADQLVGTASGVVWRHTDPVTGSHNSISEDGNIYDDGLVSAEFNAEFEPLGNAIPDSDPAEETTGIPPPYKGGGSVVSDPEYNCVVDGFLMDDMKFCSMALGSEAGVRCPYSDCGPRSVQYNGQRVWATFGAYADGYAGYLPTNARYIGDGLIEPIDGQSVSNYVLNLERQALGQLSGVPDPTVNSGEFERVMATNQESCDFRMARIFGDDDAVIATANEPITLLARNGDRLSVAGISRNYRSESPTTGDAHLYPNPAGRGELNGFAFAPPGYSSVSRPPASVNYRSLQPEVQTNFAFIYRPGALSQYGYDGGLRINFVHSGTTDAKGRLYPEDPSVINGRGSIKVGIIGNFGQPFDTGGGGPFEQVHDHLRFYPADKFGHWNVNKTIDPRTVFCHDLGF